RRNQVAAVEQVDLDPAKARVVRTDPGSRIVAVHVRVLVTRNAEQLEVRSEERRVGKEGSRRYAVAGNAERLGVAPRKLRLQHGGVPRRQQTAYGVPASPDCSRLLCRQRRNQVAAVEQVDLDPAKARVVRTDPGSRIVAVHVRVLVTRNAEQLEV